MYVFWPLISSCLYNNFLLDFQACLPTLCSAQLYVKVMKKIQDKGEEYVLSEHERLGRILSEWNVLTVVNIMFTHIW